MDDSTGNHVEEKNYCSNVSYEEITSTKEQQQTNDQETIESPNSELLNGIERPPYSNEYDFMKVEPRMYPPSIIEEIVSSNNSKPYVSFESKTEWKNSLKEELNATVQGCELRHLAKDISNNVFTTDTPQVTKKDYDKRQISKTG